MAGASLVCMGLLLVLLNMDLSSCCRPLLDYEDPEQGGSSFNVNSDDWLYGFGLDGDDGGAISLVGDDDGQGSFGVVPNFASGWADGFIDGFVAESFAGSEGDGIDINRDIGLRCYRYNCRWSISSISSLPPSITPSISFTSFACTSWCFTRFTMIHWNAVDVETVPELRSSEQRVKISTSVEVKCKEGISRRM
ncbi:hypothetical protein MRB53_026879 [Persea americana]|uniref:Uncharacterized protein n=1 Tax=Persea americana TaxID=3435 RepID=A0ACC2LK27_PERAE|nr:hypothetical protein MRB53_026879 [Persea americana]